MHGGGGGDNNNNSSDDDDDVHQPEYAVTTAHWRDRAASATAMPSANNDENVYTQTHTRYRTVDMKTILYEYLHTELRRKKKRTLFNYSAIQVCVQYADMKLDKMRSAIALRLDIFLANLSK